MSFQRILVPAELHGDAPALLRYAKKLAGPSATIRLLHVLIDETAVFYADLLDSDEVARAAQDRLDALIVEHSDESITIEPALRPAFNVHETVQEEIESFAPDVVVMGSHGRRGLQHFLLGSDVLRVLRETTKPICVVKGARHAAPESATPDKLANIAIATDFLPTSARATESFLQLVKDTGARGHVLHVFENEPWFAMGHGLASPTGGYALPIAGSDFDERMRSCREELEKKLEDFKSAHAGLELQGELLEGQAWERLAEYGKAHDIDLLLLGSHHFGTIERLMLGSIAEKILRSVDFPVLVVASPEEE